MKGKIREGKEGEKRTKETERGRRERVSKRGGHTSGITTTS